VRVPGILDAAEQNLPGDGDGRAADDDDDADGQDVEAFAEVGDVDGQGEVFARPQRQDPAAEQRGEAGGDVEVSALDAVAAGGGLGRSLLVELGETLAQGVEGPVQFLAQEGRGRRRTVRRPWRGSCRRNTGRGRRRWRQAGKSAKRCLSSSFQEVS